MKEVWKRQFIVDWEKSLDDTYINVLQQVKAQNPVVDLELRGISLDYSVIDGQVCDLDPEDSNIGVIPIEDLPPMELEIKEIGKEEGEEEDTEEPKIELDLWTLGGGKY